MVVSRGFLAVAAACSLAIVAADGARASQIVDRNASDVRLAVDGRGRALVMYRANGRLRAVLASGAINAHHPTSGLPQAKFAFDYARFNGQRRRAFRRSCRPYDGPALVWLVAACKAPDGSYWALQRWQRLQPMRGFDPFRPEHTAVELHLSHWTGPLAALEVSPNWTYGGTLQGLFGRLTYDGVPVYGSSTPNARRSDPYARFFYIDTYNSMYGPDWKRDTGVVTHVGSGAFCYTFVPQKPPPGYPSEEPRGPGNGERHRVTVIGPGVTPIVQWEGPGLGAFDPVRDAAYNLLFDTFLTGDRHCARER